MEFASNGIGMNIGQIEQMPIFWRLGSLEYKEQKTSTEAQKKEVLNIKKITILSRA